MTTEVPSILNWLDDERLACPRANLLAVFDDRSHTLQSTPDELILMKSRGMVDWYETSFAADPPRRVLEIGIFKGGSVVLFSELWRPERLVAVDIAVEPVPALAEYIRRCDLAESVRPVFGIDQADAAAMRSVISSELGAAPLDLVVDDGCHFYEETRAAFETVFPFLRHGGIYVIEDWGWAHWPGAWQDNGGPWPGQAGAHPPRARTGHAVRFARGSRRSGRDNPRSDRRAEGRGGDRGRRLRAIGRLSYRRTRLSGGRVRLPITSGRAGAESARARADDSQRGARAPAFPSHCDRARWSDSRSAQQSVVAPHGAAQTAEARPAGLMQWLVQASLPGCGSQCRARGADLSLPVVPRPWLQRPCSAEGVRAGGGSYRKKRGERRATCGPALSGESMRCSDGEKLRHQGAIRRP